MASSQIVVLGGGITGLSAAFHLTRRFPDAKITILEKGDRLGGYLLSERVTVPVQDEDGHAAEASVLLEAGPRTVRPVALAVLELINLLGLADQLVLVSRAAPAARNRFLHIPGEPGLVRIPTSFFGLLSSTIGRTLLEGVVWDMWQGDTTSKAAIVAEDESVGDFLERRFGAPFARTFGSAFVHGVYAADARQLSVRAAFPDLPRLAERGSGSVVRGGIASGVAYLFGNKEESAEEKAKREGRPYDLGAVKELMEGVSVFSLREGLEQLVHALEKRLGEMENVQIVKGAEAAEIVKYGDAFEVHTSTTTYPATHLVSALPLPALHAILARSPTIPPLPHLTANAASSVTVVNMVFAVPPERLHADGFGYLIPRPEADYSPDSTENPVGVLGTVFDSCALAAQDTHGAHLTKLTAILGGPHVLPDAARARDTFPVPRLLETLGAQIGAEMPEPVFVRVHRHEECIPVPGVGHVRRMEEVREVLEGEGWGGRMEIIGAGVGGVSVGACVQAGRDAGLKW